mgnify:CR=1 FL=1
MIEYVWKKLIPEIENIRPEKVHSDRYDKLVYRYNVGHIVNSLIDIHMQEYIDKNMTIMGVKEGEVKELIIGMIVKHIAKKTKLHVNKCFYRFYPVGQGLMCGIFACRFDHERTIDHGETMSVFERIIEVSYRAAISHLTIYDCGSTTSNVFKEKETVFSLFNEDCKQFKVIKYSKDKYLVDQLIISHFDNDHINGIPEILKCCNVKNLIYPFCTDLDRLYMLFLDPQPEMEGKEFFELPEYLSLKFQAENMIEVRTGNNVDAGIKYFLKDGAGIQGIAGTLTYDPADYMNDSGASKSYIAYLSDGTDAEGKNVSTYFDDGVWAQQIIFCVPSKKTYEEIMKKVNETFKKNIPDWEKWNWERKRSYLLELYLTSYINFDNLREAFNGIYQGEGTGTNNSSICYFYGPSKSDKSLNKDYELNSISVNSKTIREIRKDLNCSGLLLTGDTCLFYGRNDESTESNLHAETIIKEMKGKNVFPGAILLPHHGSEHNIDAQTWEIMESGTSAKTWIVSFGIDYRFGHPNAIPCQLFGVHICPVIQKGKIDEDRAKKRFLPEREDLYLICKNKVSEVGPQELINDVELLHCTQGCCILLESYSI